MSNINLGTASFRITGDASGATNAATQANNALASLSGIVSKNYFGIKSLALAFTALPAAVAAGTGIAVRSAIEWQDAMFELSRATGDSADAVDRIGRSVLQVAQTTPIATSSLLALAASGAQLGIADDNLASFSQTMGGLLSVTNLTEASVGDFARVINVLQVPEDQFQQFGNTLLEVGRNTAATETEILNISRRISGAAAIAGITSDQVLGLGAAIISLGPRAEAGGTAFNKTIADMLRAVGTGDEKLTLFAQVAGKSAEEFRQAFQVNAAQAFADFITGLGRLGGSGTQAIAVLDSLGITESRQATALLQLASGTKDVGNQQRDLNAILKLSNDSFQNSTALQDLMAQKAKTLSGQLQLLKNAVFQGGAAFGKAFIGPITVLISLLADFATGLGALPGPLKVLVGGLIFLIAAFSGLAAIALLVGPRLILAYQAVINLMGAANGGTGATGRLAGALGVMGASAGGALGPIGALTAELEFLNVALTGANSSVIGGISSIFTFTSAAAAEGAAAAVAAEETTALGSSFGFLGPIGIAAGVATAGLAIFTTILGHKQRQAAIEANTSVTANKALTKAIATQGSVVGPATDAWLSASKKFQRAAIEAAQLGINLEVLKRIVLGIATPSEVNSFADSLAGAGKEGRKLAKNVSDLIDTIDKSGSAAGVTGKSIDELGNSEGSLGGQAQKTNDALQKQIELLTQQAEAVTSLLDAEEGVRTATLDLTKAQDDYQKALDDQAHSTEILASAEDALELARLNQIQAASDLFDAEQNLANARDKSQQDVIDAELSLEDARANHVDTLSEIVQLEEKVNSLRGGPETRDLVKATNDLRNAELRLVKAHQTVSDAEFSLQMLKEEGASARDISDAEFSLAEAKQAVADANADVTDSQDKLNNLGIDNQKELIQAEKDLAKARRTSIKDVEDVTEAEKKLKKARDDLAADKGYLEAQKGLVEAHKKVQDATLQTVDAEEKLNQLRAGSLNDAVQKGEINLENAILGVARANVEVTRQTKLANGETFDAADAAHALGVELDKLNVLGPTEESRKRLHDFAEELHHVLPIPKPPKDPYGLDGAGAAGAKAGKEAGENFRKAFNESSKKKSGPSFGDFLTGELKTGFSLALNTIKEWGPKIGRGIVDTITELPGASAELLNQIFFDMGDDIIKGLGKGIVWAFTHIPVLSNFGHWAYTNIVKPFKEEFSIGSPSKVMEQLGKDLIQGLLNGIVSLGPMVLNFFLGLPGQILGAIGDLGGLLIQKGRDLLNGFTNGVSNFFSNNLIPFMQGIPGSIKNIFIDAKNLLLTAGHDIIRGLIKGVEDFFKNHFRGAWNGLVKLIPGDFAKGLEMHSPSKVFEVFGNNIVQGLINGIENEERALLQTMKATSGILEDSLNQNFSASVLGDPNVLRDAFNNTVAGVRAATQAVNTTTTNNGGDTLNLNAITTADPQQIINAYVWQKRVRLRGK